MQGTIQKIVHFVKGMVEPEMIILFGSVADGKFNENSDIDLLIVTGDLHLKRSYTEKIINYSRELSLKADVLIYSTGQLEKESGKANSFVGSIMKHGKILYKKSTK